MLFYFPENGGAHNEAAKEVHEVHVVVEPEKPSEVPEPPAAPKPHEVTEVQVSHNPQDSKPPEVPQILPTEPFLSNILIHTDKIM